MTTANQSYFGGAFLVIYSTTVPTFSIRLTHTLSTTHCCMVNHHVRNLRQVTWYMTRCVQVSNVQNDTDHQHNIVRNQPQRQTKFPQLTLQRFVLQESLIIYKVVLIHTKDKDKQTNKILCCHNLPVIAHHSLSMHIHLP